MGSANSNGWQFTVADLRCQSSPVWHWLLSQLPVINAIGAPELSSRRLPEMLNPVANSIRKKRWSNVGGSERERGKYWGGGGGNGRMERVDEDLEANRTV